MREHEEPPRDGAPEAATRARRRAVLLAGLLTLGVLAGGAAAVRLWPAAPPAPAGPALAADTRGAGAADLQAVDAGAAEEAASLDTPADGPWEDHLRVLSVRGEVQRRTGGAQEWTALRHGEELRADDAIRTRDSGRAVLGLGEGGRVEVAPRTEVSVREISRSFARMRLEQGRVVAALAEGGGGRLRVETRGSDAHAESTGGEFAVLGAGDGHLAVAATRGNLRLSVGARSVVVQEGQQSVADPTTGPSAPRAPPRSLYLKVGRPGPVVQRERETVVRGTTAPGAVVSVNELRVPADETGAFEVAVPLQRGVNRLVLEAEDPQGRRTRVRLPNVTVKSEVSPVKTRVTWPGGGASP